MSQISKELSHINRIRQLLETEFKTGKITSFQYYDLDLKYLIASSRLINSAVQIMISSAKHGRKIRDQADKTNIYSLTTAVNTSDAEIEMIKCPDKDGCLITRAKCLDYSGSHETCLTCENDRVTKNLLLPINN